jgi:molybdopterin converting factor subunit 1
MRVRVRLFAAARQAAGASEIELDLPAAATVAELRAALADRIPALRPALGSLMIAVDAEYAPDDLPISPDAEVAAIPPVSGGAP